MFPLVLLSLLSVITMLENVHKAFQGKIANKSTLHNWLKSYFYDTVSMPDSIFDVGFKSSPSECNQKVINSLETVDTSVCSRDVQDTHWCVLY